MVLAFACCGIAPWVVIDTYILIPVLLNQAVGRVLGRSDVKERLDGLATDVATGTPAEFTQLVRKHSADRLADVGCPNGKHSGRIM